MGFGVKGESKELIKKDNVSAKDIESFLRNVDQSFVA